MALHKKHLKQADFDSSNQVVDAAPKPLHASPRLVDGEIEATVSPVHGLQDRISHELSEDQQDKTWSARRTLLVAGAFSGFCWALLFFALR